MNIFELLLTNNFSWPATPVDTINFTSSPTPVDSLLASLTVNTVQV